MPKKLNHRETFAGVLANYDDQCIVRQLLCTYVPLDVQEVVIRKFNNKIDEYNKLMGMPNEQDTNR